MTYKVEKSLPSNLKEKIAKLRLVAFDFDGVFTNNMVYISQDGSEIVRCWRGDGIGLKKLINLGIDVVVISSEINPVVTLRCNKLGIRCVQGCEDKAVALEQISHELGITLNEIAFVGNDINDLPCLTYVSVPIIVHDAHPNLIPYALFRTKLKGGCGAVREICDLFERVLQKSDVF